MLIRETVLNVLVDLLGAFEAATGFESVSGSDGRIQPLKLVLSRAVAQYSFTIRACLTRAKEESREHKLAAEVLSFIGHSK